jgi:AcrR family transcriptional regulator
MRRQAVARSEARPGPRPRFTRDQVLTSALRLIEDMPPEEFSMRVLADELGMGVMTLYGYVRNKGDMIDGVTALAFAELDAELGAEAGWEERLRDEVNRLYRVSRRHPHLVALILAQTTASPGLFRLRERMLATLLGAGFDELRALQALGILTSYALGFGLRAGATIDLPERIRELPVEGFPRLHSAADEYAAHLSDEAFTHGLDLLLSGLRSDLETGPPQNPPPDTP